MPPALLGERRPREAPPLRALGTPAGLAAGSPNLDLVRKLSFVLTAAFLAMLPSAEAAPGMLPELPPLGAAEAPLFAAGGTPLTNGVFFPGTAMCVGTDCQGAPYQVARGTDIRFYNLDNAAVANSHRIVSKKMTKKGRPLFQSETTSGPGSTLMKTSHLKPGIYPFFCSVHYGMAGTLEITG